MKSGTSTQSTLGISLKAIVLSIILIIILTASNVYLALKVGVSISPSIPAIVIAIGVFRLFRKYTVYEINTVQAVAAAGEGITGGIVFILPALVIMHFWPGFSFWQTALIGIVGGITGVLISTPLRRALLKDKTLKFPEGTAIGRVMKASIEAKSEVKPIIQGTAVSSIIALCQNGFKVLAQGYDYWAIKSNMVFGFGLGFSPAVIAAGYICGIVIAVGVLVGVIIGWLIGIPLLSLHYGFSHTATGADIANQIWSHYTRYIGVATMLIGGIWTIIMLIKPIIHAVHSSITALHTIRSGEGHKIHRTERDIPINIAFWGVGLMGIALLIDLLANISPPVLGISAHFHLAIMLLCTGFFFLAGFIFSAISGYFAGLVGVTNSPGSGLFISMLLILSLLLYAILDPHINFAMHPNKSIAVAGLVVMVCAFLGTSITVAGDSVQVAKAGSIVKATPWIQQLALIGGVIIASLTIPLILSLLFNAYGIGGVFPHPGMSHNEMLAAPQAGLVAAVAQAVFYHRIPWPMMFIGAIIAVICIIIDEFLKFKFNKRLLVLGVGLGIYLPLSVAIPVIIGGFLSYFVNCTLHKSKTITEKQQEKNRHNAMFIACGLIAGSTLMGVILAIPFIIFKNTEILRLVPERFANISGILSIIITIALCYWLYCTATMKAKMTIKQ